MGPADFLISKRQQRLFSALFLHPERSYSTSELVALSGAGKGAGQYQIDKLARAGVLTAERVGNQRRLKVNQEFPLYDELRSLCVKSFGVSEVLADALAPFADEIRLAFIFGSVAKQTDRSSSDIDLLVVGDVQLSYRQNAADFLRAAKRTDDAPVVRFTAAYEGVLCWRCAYLAPTVCAQAISPGIDRQRLS